MALPSSTFSRASVGTVVDYQGKIVEIPTGKRRFQGLRVVVDGSDVTYYTTDNAGDPITSPAVPVGVLIEPSRTNEIVHSDDLEDAAWVPAGSGTGTLPVVTNLGIGALGIPTFRVDFDKGAGTTASDLSVLQQSIGSSSDPDATFSCWCRKVSGDSNALYARTDLGSQAFLPVSSEWSKLEHSVEQENGAGLLIIGLRDQPSVTTLSIEVCAMQFERAAASTSYIATSGSAVSRAADGLSYSNVPAANSTVITTPGGDTAVTDWNGVVPDGVIQKIAIGV
jgi:hypothetical protein